MSLSEFRTRLLLVREVRVLSYELGRRTLLLVKVLLVNEFIEDKDISNYSSIKAIMEHLLHNGF